MKKKREDERENEERERSNEVIKTTFFFKMFENPQTVQMN